MRCTVAGDTPTNPENASVPNDAKRPDGQHVDHWTMCPTEIMKAGLQRPVRLSYRHVGAAGPANALRDLTPEEHEQYDRFGYVKFEAYPEGGATLGRYWTQNDLDKIGKGCGAVTSMPVAIAETYAANPGYYGSTFCCGCGAYRAVGAHGEFVWDGTDERVGT